MYPNTAGMATVRAAAVAMRAVATPGATAPIFPDPFDERPRNELMMPSTVPRSPMSGLAEAIIASTGI